jgi:Uma2 family endonuclease
MATTASSLELVLQSSEAIWNRERWEELPEDGKRYEVINGVLYMSTAPSPLHQWISRHTQRLLYAQIDDLGYGITFNAPVGLFMPGCDPVQPDLLVLKPEDQGLILEKHIETIPLLLVEILSPSNPNHDLVLKRQAYARAGVPEYWVLRPQERDVLVHSEPELATGQFLRTIRVATGEELASPTLPFRAPVAAFFALPSQETR